MSKAAPIILIVCAGMILASALAKGWFEHTDHPGLLMRYQVKVGLLSSTVCRLDPKVCRTVDNRDLPETWPGYIDAKTQHEMLKTAGGTDLSVNRHDFSKRLRQEIEEKQEKASRFFSFMKATFIVLLVLGGMIALVGTLAAIEKLPHALITAAFLLNFGAMIVTAIMLMQTPRSVGISFSIIFAALGICLAVPMLLVVSKHVRDSYDDWIDPTATGAWNYS